MPKTLSETVDYVNFYYYSAPMSVINLKTLQIPYPVSLTKLQKDEHQFLIRVSHGLPHVLSAMTLINSIFDAYLTHLDTFNESFNRIAAYVLLTAQDLLHFIKIAVLFHDAGRKGDGLDLWDEDSAELCKKYLLEQCQLEDEVAGFIADTIRFKDNSAAFKNKYAYIHVNVDYIRELVNMADTLEVIRTRNVFKPEFLPISYHVTPETMVNRIIPELVVPHREKILNEGRLSKEGRIDYSKDGYSYQDAFVHTSGKNFALIAKTYHEACKQYDLSILDIHENNIHQVIERGLRGVQMYLDAHQTSGIQWTHNGFFSPRYHGALGLNRAKYYKNILASEASDQDKIKVLYALFSSPNGVTLKETVLRSFNQINQELVLNHLKDTMLAFNISDSPDTLKDSIHQHIKHAEMRHG